MIEMSDIYSGIARTGAALYSYDIGFSDAATIELNGRYAVMFDPSLFSSIRERTLCHRLHPQNRQPLGSDRTP